MAPLQPPVDAFDGAVGEGVADQAQLLIADHRVLLGDAHHRTVEFTDHPGGPGIALQQTALAGLPGGLAVALLSTAPVMALPLAVLEGDRPGWRGALAAGAALAGVSLVAGLVGLPGA